MWKDCKDYLVPMVDVDVDESLVWSRKIISTRQDELLWAR